MQSDRKKQSDKMLPTYVRLSLRLASHTPRILDVGPLDASS